MLAVSDFIDDNFQTIIDNDYYSLTSGFETETVIKDGKEYETGSVVQYVMVPLGTFDLQQLVDNYPNKYKFKVIVETPDGIETRIYGTENGFKLHKITPDRIVFKAGKETKINGIVTEIEKTVENEN